NPANLANARALGLVAEVAEGPEIGKQLKQLTDGQGVAVILDMVGPDWDALLPGLRTEGALVMIGLLGGASTTLNLGGLLQRRQHLSAMTMRSQPLENRIRMATLFNDRLAPLFTGGRL